MAKEKMFWGYSEETLRDVKLEDFIKLVDSRTRRALTRLKPEGTFYKLLNKIRKLKAKGKITKPVKTHSRNSVILPEWIGIRFQVYNGKEWKEVDITADKVGKRLGMFSFTTGYVKHSGPGVGATRSSKFVPLK